MAKADKWIPSYPVVADLLAADDDASISAHLTKPAHSHRRQQRYQAHVDVYFSYASDSESIVLVSIAQGGKAGKLILSPTAAQALAARLLRDAEELLALERGVDTWGHDS